MHERLKCLWFSDVPIVKSAARHPPSLLVSSWCGMSHCRASSKQSETTRYSLELAWFEVWENQFFGKEKTNYNWRLKGCNIQGWFCTHCKHKILWQPRTCCSWPWRLSKSSFLNFPFLFPFFVAGAFQEAAGDTGEDRRDFWPHHRKSCMSKLPFLAWKSLLF